MGGAPRPGKHQKTWLTLYLLLCKLSLTLAVRLWCLRFKYNHGRRGGFSPPWFVTRAIGAGKTRPYVGLRGCVLFSKAINARRRRGSSFRHVSDG
jgi:hypothetical protein